MGRQPISILLNEIVNVFAARTFPFGFDISPSAPNSWNEVRDQLHYGGRISIWEGDFGEHSSFADKETWQAFRAWHDYIHVRWNFCFDKKGEYGTAAIQTLLIYRIYGKSEAVIEATAVMWAEQIEPLERAWAHLPVVADAWDWNSKRFHVWLPMAQLLAQQDCWTDAGCRVIAQRIGEAREHPIVAA